MPSDYGLRRALLKLLPLSKGLNPVSLGQRENVLFQKIEKYEAPMIRPYRLRILSAML